MKKLLAKIRTLCRHARKYLTELVLFPYRLFCIYQKLAEVSLKLREISLVLGCERESMQSLALPRKHSCALMTVVIMRENAAFLDEWISHHLQIGVDHVFLYDNSLSQYDNNIGIEVVGGTGGAQSTNKHGVNYAAMLGQRATDDFVKKEVDRLLKNYAGQLTIVPWERSDENGRVCYFQNEAIVDFVLRSRSRYHYGLAIDCDEFLISERGWRIADLIREMEERGISSGLIGQRRFLYRFCNVDIPVRSIPWCLHHDAESADYGACKSIFRLDLFTGFGQRFIVHYIPTLLGCGRIRWQDMRFHHYGWPGFRQRRSLKELDESEQQFLTSEFRRDESMFRYLEEQGK